MKKIGILGGAFDPITKGHLEVAMFVLKHTDMDRIWIMPVPNHPFGKKMASYSVRRRMIQLSLGGNIDNRITWSDFELDRNLSGKTWETLRSLQRAKSHKDDLFYWIIGTDEACTISAWANAEWLQKKGKFIIVPRKGYGRATKRYLDKADQPWAHGWIWKHPNINLIGKGSVGNTSSTKARKAVQDGKKGLRRLKNLVPENIIRYIQENKIYATPDER